VVESIAPSGWFRLGSGNGLRVWVTGRPAGAQKGDDVKATLKSADRPLTLNAWNEAFYRIQYRPLAGGRWPRRTRPAGTSSTMCRFCELHLDLRLVNVSPALRVSKTQL